MCLQRDGTNGLMDYLADVLNVLSSSKPYKSSSLHRL